MRVARIIKHDEGYRLLCEFTMEDSKLLPEGVSLIKLLGIKFPIENMSSAAGFWFRPCSERHWGGTGEYLVEPPRVEEESTPPSRRGQKKSKSSLQRHTKETPHGDIN